ncbi:MAG: Crp/Fnr family transcriptional regulator [Patescibacteria group bacterium]|nr:Crp/Fnr family transcriptional regulator [Patescibacteria group bacterium]
MQQKLPELFNSFSQFDQQILYRRREIIIRPSDESGGIFYIKQGYVRQYAISSEGIELTLNIFGPSSVFPILSSINELSNGYYYESLTPVEVYRAPKEKFLTEIKNNITALYELEQQILVFSASLLKKLESMAFCDAMGKIVVSLLDLVNKFGRKHGKKTVIDYWFTHHDIATITGLSRETVSLEIKKLWKKKIISYENHLIEIKDVKGLSEIISCK